MNYKKKSKFCLTYPCNFRLWISTFILLFSLSAIPKNPPVLLDFSDQLYQAQNYSAAITEYYRFLCFHSDHPKAFYAYYKIGMAYYAQSDWQNAVYYFRQALYLRPEKQFMAKIRYQQILAHVANNDLNPAKLELFRLIHTKNIPQQIKTAAQIIYGMLLIYQKQWTSASKNYQEILQIFPQNNEKRLNGLTQLIQQLDQMTEKPLKKNPNSAKWLSTFIPGLGQIYAGKWVSGLNAFALNSLTTYWLGKNIWEKELADAGLIYMLVWERYYSGNRLHAEEAAQQTNLGYQEKNIQQMLILIQKIVVQMPQNHLQIKLIDL